VIICQIQKVYPLEALDQVVGGLVGVLLFQLVYGKIQAIDCGGSLRETERVHQSLILQQLVPKE
jgi:hypothetical protein